MVPCDSVPTALDRFRAFPAAEGWPTAVAWVPASRVIRTAGKPIAIESTEPSQRAQAAKEYDIARHRGLGVCFDAICTISGTTYATAILTAAEPQRYARHVKGSIWHHHEQATRDESCPTSACSRRRPVRSSAAAAEAPRCADSKTKLRFDHRTSAPLDAPQCTDMTWCSSKV